MNRFLLFAVYILLALSGKTQLNVQAGGIVEIADGSKIITQSNVTAQNDISGTGTISLTGNALQTINLNGFSLANLEIVNNSLAGVNIGGLTYITRSLSFGNINNAKLNTGGFLTFRSNAIATASLADITNAGVNSGNQILGDVTVERFIPSGKRAYRQLSSGVNSTANIYTNWQTSGANATGLGMHITGSVTGTNGFDATAGGAASMYTYTPGSPNFSPIPNTNATNLKALQGYRIFVIGDRNANLTIANNMGTGTSNINLNNETTLRAKGTIITNAVTYNSTGATANGSTDNSITLGANAGNFSLISNPYWSPVNFDAITKSFINGTYWIWDPSIGNRGTYVSWTTSSQMNNNGGSNMNNHIQPGQAIFVQTSAANPSITFNEENKSSTFTNTFRAATETPSKIRIYLYENNSHVNNGTIQDAATIAFRDDFMDVVGQEDAAKFTNTDENIAILNGSTLLGLEARSTIIAADTIPLRIWKLFANNNYTLKLDASDFDAGTTCFLHDKYLNQQHAIDMAGSNTFPFSFASDSASYYNRFSLVFRPATPLPVHFISVNGYKKNTGIEVGWKVAEGPNVVKYAVEKSVNGTAFEIGGEVIANNSKAYDWMDAKPTQGNNFYRIKAIKKDNTYNYSSVVNVVLGNIKGDVLIYPNPVQGGVINLQFTNREKGNYALQVFNNAGQQVFTGNILHQGGSASIALQNIPLLVKGIYQMVIRNGGNNITQQVIVE